MEWIIKIEKNPEIEDERDQRIRVLFNPQLEIIQFFGEVKIKNNQWYVFSQDTHALKIDLDQLQQVMEGIVILMRKRLVEYENLAQGFTVLKEIAIKEPKD